MRGDKQRWRAGDHDLEDLRFHSDILKETVISGDDYVKPAPSCSRSSSSYLW